MGQLGFARNWRAIALPRHPVWDPLGHRQVQQYLREQLSPLGPLSEQVFTADPGQGCNLILHLPGTEPTADPILVGAHYDGVPGIAAADDNASGVAALLALAGAIAPGVPQNSKVNRYLFIIFMIVLKAH